MRSCVGRQGCLTVLAMRDIVFCHVAHTDSVCHVDVEQYLFGQPASTLPMNGTLLILCAVAL